MYNEFCQRLMRGLRLEMVPVAVFFSTNPPGNTKQLNCKLKACEMLDVARYEGKVFYSTAENHECKNGMYYLGLTKAFAGLKTGDWTAGRYPEKGRSNWASPVAFRRTLNYYPRIEEETVKCISYAPLDKCPFKPEIGGGIVVLTCTPKQGLYLARAAVYEMGGVINGIVGPSTCSVVMAGPIQKGEMFYTLGCYGGRIFVKIKTEELYFGFPIEFLEKIVISLEIQLRDRPDLDIILDEGVGTYHIAIEEEKMVQISPQAIEK
jgi:uncharacterized protein (DUF169 family)